MTSIQGCASPKYRARIFLLPLVSRVTKTAFEQNQPVQGCQEHTARNDCREVEI